MTGRSAALVVSALALLSLDSTANESQAGADGEHFLPGTDDLAAVVEKLQPERDSLAIVSVRNLVIWQTTSEPWSKISPGDLRKGSYKPSDDDDYAVAAILACYQSAAGMSYQHQKVAWFLLEGNHLVAYDHHRFGNQCTVWNSFRPATGGAIATESTLLERIRKSHPESMVNWGEEYAKGLALVEVCRLEDARRRLERADRSVDVGFSRPHGSPRADRNRDENPSTRDQVMSLREQLVRAIDRGCPSPNGD